MGGSPFGGPPYLLMNPDITIIQACIKGNERAYHTLYSCCYSSMMGISMRYMCDEQEANSIVNKAFLKIIQNLAKWDANRSFEAWARTITVNTALDACRKKSTMNKNIPLAPLDIASNDSSAISFNSAEGNLNAEILEQMISALPEMHRNVFNLYAIDGFSHKEVAEMLSCSESSSKWYLHQARKILQEKLENLLLNEKKYQHG